jgi:hypothetical protein
LTIDFPGFFFAGGRPTGGFVAEAREAAPDLEGVEGPDLR